MMIGLGALAALAFGLTLVVGLVQKRWLAKDDELVEQVNRLLPQTQCAQCGYPGCRPYAQAILHEGAAIDLCPPGGTETVVALEKLLDRSPAQQSATQQVPALALIDEAQCIGCTLCIAACPVDAIIGASQWMHSVIRERCTGCELCIEPCPVDCITMEEIANAELRAPEPHPIPCVHCNACTTACPEHLNVEHLYQLSAKDDAKAAGQAGVLQCIRCGQCDAVCPSDIPLTAFFRYTQQRHQNLQDAQAEAELAQQRYDQHQQRIEYEQAQEQAVLQEQKEQLKAKLREKGAAGH